MTKCVVMSARRRRTDVSTIQLSGHQWGVPVRNTDARPWPTWLDNTPARWKHEVGPALREVYLSGVEGTPAPKGKQFAQALADYCGTQHGVLMAHGTNAIAAAVAASLDLDGLSDGGEVIVLNYTYLATATAPMFVGCSVCFVDVDSQSATLDPTAVEAAVGHRTRAISPVHVKGQTADMYSLRMIAEHHFIVIIEDCSHAHGAEYNSHRAGSLCDASGFSFQASKTLILREGGAVTTDDATIRNRVVSFMDVGRHPEGGRWEYLRLGWNYRTSEYVAAQLQVRLTNLEQEIETRTRNANYLSAQLEGIEGVLPVPLKPWAMRHAYHLYPYFYDADVFGCESVETEAATLRAEGVPGFRGYDALSSQGAIQTVARYHPHRIRIEPCPNVERISASTL